MDPTAQRVKGAVLFMSGLTVLFGIGEIIACAVALRNSGYYGGAWYAGIASILAGTQGLRITSMSYFSRIHLKWISISAIFSTIICVFGAAFDGAEYTFFESMEACAAGSSTLSNTCIPTNFANVSAYYECTGNSAYYGTAALCDYDAQMEGNIYDCSCVNTNTDATCYYFDGFPSCAYILNDFPKQLHASYALSMLCLFSSLVLAILAGQYCCCANDFDNSNLSEPVLAPTVVVASAQYINSPNVDGSNNSIPLAGHVVAVTNPPNASNNSNSNYNTSNIVTAKEINFA